MQKALIYTEKKPEKYIDQIGYANNMASMASILYCQNKLRQADNYIGKAIVIYSRFKLDQTDLNDIYIRIHKTQNSHPLNIEAGGNCKIFLPIHR